VPIDPDAVRQARLKAGLSLAQVAGTELTRQAVHLIETGKVRPSLRSLRLIARRLGVPPEAFQLAADADADSPQRWAAELERLCEWQRYQEAEELARGLLGGDHTAAERAIGSLYLGRVLVHLGNGDEALRHLRRAGRLLREEGDPWLAAEARDWEAGALDLKEDPRAVAVAEDALRRYRLLEPRTPEIEARMLEHLAAGLTRRGDFTRARACYQEALRVAGPVLDLVRLARMYHGMSGCHASLGQFRQAIDLASRAVALYAVENDLRPLPARIDLPRIENDLGSFLLLDGQIDRAEELFQSALGRLEAAGMRRLRSYVILGLAEVAQARCQLDEAIDLAGRAIACAEEAQEPMALAVVLQQLGQLHADRREPELAAAAFDRALAAWTELGLTGQRDECLAARRRALETGDEVARLERSAG
jgi:tetratricopeptide (TPR) repeat protein